MATITLHEAGSTSNHAILTRHYGVNYNEKNNIRQAVTTHTGSALPIAEILHHAGTGIWSYDVTTQVIHLCKNTASFLGHDTEMLISKNALTKNLLALQQHDFLKTIGNSCIDLKDFDVEIYLDAADKNQPKWLRIKGNLHFEPKKAVRIIGSVTDITTSKTKLQRHQDLMALLCHELKNPLSILKLGIQVSEKKLAANNIGATENMFGICNREIINMTGLINNFLDMSLTENAVMQLQKTDFEITKILHDVISGFAALHPEYNFRFNLSDDIVINGDAEKIKQVLINYICNAIKYSPDNKDLALSCYKQNGELVVYVSDNGIGISSKNQQYLFTRFGRITNKKSSGIKGFGLGLFLSKEIITSHSGRVWVSSNTGQGATFYFSLPL